MEGAEPPLKRQKTSDASLGPELRFPGRLIYVTTAAAVPEAVAALIASLRWMSPNGGGRAEDVAIPKQGEAQVPRSDVGLQISTAEAVVGFDIEWRATFQRGQPQRKAATLQLATADVAYVFQLSKIGCVSAPLADLLGRADVLKVGVGVDGDARKLERDYGGLASRCEELLVLGGMQHADRFCEEHGVFRVRGLLDLNHLSRYALDVAHARSSLAALCGELLGGHLAKPEDVRMGDWEAFPLSELQLVYSATDAWVGVRCFEAMLAKEPAALQRLRDGLLKVSAPAPESAKPTGPAQKVEATASLKPLPPAKQQVYDLFSHGHSAASIADVRGVKLVTVLGYLTEAVSAGYAYDWARFAVPPADEEAVTAAIDAKASEGMKAIKEAVPEHIDYLTIKLVQAHIARKAPVPT